MADSSEEEANTLATLEGTLPSHHGTLLASVGTLRHQPSEALLSASTSDDIFLKPQVTKSKPKEELSLVFVHDNQDVV